MVVIKKQVVLKKVALINKEMEVKNQAAKHLLFSTLKNDIYNTKL